MIFYEVNRAFEVGRYGPYLRTEFPEKLLSKSLEVRKKKIP